MLDGPALAPTGQLNNCTRPTLGQLSNRLRDNMLRLRKAPFLRDSAIAFRSDLSPKRSVRSRHSSLSDLMNRSMCGDRFGERGGKRTQFALAPSRMARNPSLHLVSRSTIT